MAQTVAFLSEEEKILFVELGNKCPNKRRKKGELQFFKMEIVRTQIAIAVLMQQSENGE